MSVPRLLGSNNPFDQKKRAILSQIEVTSEINPDASPKGTLDIKLLPLIELINSHEDMVTTSSCSGRVSVYLEGDKTVVLEERADSVDAAATREKVGAKGAGGKWLFVTHDPLYLSESWWTDAFNYTEAIDSSDAFITSIRYVLYKFEAMILHIKCRDHKSASTLYNLAMSCGFRESGIGSNDLVAIRISLKLDAPVAYLDKNNLSDGNATINPLVNSDYMKLLTKMSLDRFQENFRRMDELMKKIRDNMFGDAAANINTDNNGPSGKNTAWEDKEARRLRKREEGLKKKQEMELLREKTKQELTKKELTQSS
ncbi:hypothetical protein NADFUDRAFT_70880 [Nadsonia fulvescens var. elongata DSM 6958]|uniref:tRNA wybutosine-synthesizing protein 3 n=1 Tax=Nadsonia fulvescens var. elongata DSM 6958 TaxID=857566 RepID=A0A1E3PKQ0_9ASCO|nr:hypothetical protein NADFUDRAFT_70880 [Nadsonia fulvescens var. elongata DSM 6958]